MSYNKTTWVNDSSPSINATNLNKIEQGIYDAHEELDSRYTDSEIDTMVGAKSTVSVSNSGTSEDTVAYITIDGVEKKLPTGGGGGGSTDWSDITNKPSTFTPSAHNHTVSDVTDFPTIPSKTSELTNDSNFVDNTYHDSTKSDTTHNHDGTYSVLSHTHTWNNITDKPASFTPSSHTHSAADISAGTMTGKVVANSAAVGTLSDSQVRNITVSTSEPTSGVGNNGDIWIVI